MFYRQHPRVTFDCGDQMVTKQSHKEECDIHNILRQYQRTGIIAHVQAARPTYQDLPDPLDYQASIAILDEAQAAFAALPSSVRSHFDNDPQAFLAAFADKAQEGYLRSVGLLLPAAAENPPAAAPGSTTAPSAVSP